ncbi:MAG TPA: hypothetical protein DCY13_09960 [Verrucomicrobiales bacterium]|nr:hypothetical protein [Verrucomicrobiales bacterium]
MARFQRAVAIVTLVSAVPGSFVMAAPGDLPSPLVTHPELEISLFAMEPDVVDPVALCFDADGRMYVVEMRDYPLGVPPANEPGGSVRLLVDADQDGHADRSTPFAEGLSYPTSIAPHRDGVIVAAPPEIIFLRDTDGDGRADVREVIYRGFRRGVTDGNMSGLRWGLDNWLHGVNGGHGGNVYSPRNPVEPLRLGNLDFRMRPDNGVIETTFTTGGGFGLVFDEWGRSFTPHNVNHIQMRIMPARSLGRHPGMPPRSGTENISDHGAMARIFAISEARTRPNHPEQAGHFSSAGGIGFIGHQGYPGDLAGSVTVCDVVGNLVHRDVLGEHGPVMNASRAPGEQSREFIASTDPSFRPTGLELGPDGALYLMDMHRAVIEHPDYIPRKMLETLDVRAGDRQGRIYRLIPTSGVRQNQSPISQMTPTELVEELASPNQWRRMTAQRLIVEQNHLIASVPLQQVVKRHVNPLARVHAMWALAGIGELGESMLATALEDADPGVQENAILLAAGFTPESRNIRGRLLGLVRTGATPRIRFMALQAVDALDLEALREAVSGVLRRDGLFPWSRQAALAALPDGELPMLISLLGDREFLSEPFSSDVLGDLSDLAGARLDPVGGGELDRLFRALGGGAVSEPLKLAILDAFLSGLGRNSNRPTDRDNWPAALDALAENGASPVQRAAWSLQNQLGLPASPSREKALTRALKLAADPQQPEPERVEAIELLALGDAVAVRPALLDRLQGTESLDIQRAALGVLRNLTDIAIAKALLERWRAIHPALKHDVVRLLLSRRDYHDALLGALDEGRLVLGELNLDLEDRRRLLRWSSPEIQARAMKLLGDGEYGNRQQKVDEWLAKLPKSGNAGRGRSVFEAACARCHKAGELGFDVGPDLSDQSHRSVEDLVSNILDPNMAINPNYLGLAVETSDGEILTGILVAETPDAITLSQAGGIQIILKRERITRLETTGTSLMPEGLEADMSPGQLRDLVAFLQKK